MAEGEDGEAGPAPSRRRRWRRHGRAQAACRIGPQPLRPTALARTGPARAAAPGAARARAVPPLAGEGRRRARGTGRRPGLAGRAAPASSNYTAPAKDGSGAGRAAHHRAGGQPTSPGGRPANSLVPVRLGGHEASSATATRAGTGSGRAGRGRPPPPTVPRAGVRYAASMTVHTHRRPRSGRAVLALARSSRTAIARVRGPIPTITVIWDDIGSGAGQHRRTTDGDRPGAAARAAGFGGGPAPLRPRGDLPGRPRARQGLASARARTLSEGPAPGSSGRRLRRGPRSAAGSALPAAPGRAAARGPAPPPPAGRPGAPWSSKAGPAAGSGSRPAARGAPAGRGGQAGGGRVGEGRQQELIRRPAGTG